MVDKKIKTIREGRAGRVKVAHLEITRYQKQREDVRDYFPEREIVRDAVVIQIGRKKRDGTWNNDNKLWMSTYEFIKLRDAIRDFMDKGDGESSSSTKPAKKASGKRQLTDAEKRLAELADGGGNKPSSDFSNKERGDAQ